MVDREGTVDTADNRSSSLVADTEAAEDRAAAEGKRRMPQRRQQDTSELNRTYWYLRLAVQQKTKRAGGLEDLRKSWGWELVLAKLSRATRPLESYLILRTQSSRECSPQTLETDPRYPHSIPDKHRQALNLRPIRP
jgi:hypothetical protein